MGLMSKLQRFRLLSVGVFPYPSNLGRMRRMSDQLRGERLQIMLTENELAALDDWRFARRMPSRAAAVRALLRLGLTAEGMNLTDGRMRSKDFGITDGEDDTHAPRPRHTNGDGADL